MPIITDDISKYDKDWWEKFYSAHTHSYNDEELKAFKVAKEYIGDRFVLDVGCGEGFFSQYCDHYFGIDWSEEAIKKAKQLYPKAMFKSGNLSSIKEKFDIAILSMVFEHLDRPKEYVAEIKKKAKEVIIIIPNGDAGRICVENDRELIRKFSEYTEYHYATYGIGEIMELFPDAKCLLNEPTVLVFVV